MRFGVVHKSVLTIPSTHLVTPKGLGEVLTSTASRVPNVGSSWDRDGGYARWLAKRRKSRWLRKWGRLAREGGQTWREEYFSSLREAH